jgi:hypothetical protein
MNVQKLCHISTSRYESSKILVHPSSYNPKNRTMQGRYRTGSASQEKTDLKTKKEQSNKKEEEGIKDTGLEVLTQVPLNISTSLFETSASHYFFSLLTLLS